MTQVLTDLKESLKRPSWWVSAGVLAGQAAMFHFSVGKIVWTHVLTALFVAFLGGRFLNVPRKLLPLTVAGKISARDTFLGGIAFASVVAVALVVPAIAAMALRGQLGFSYAATGGSTVLHPSAASLIMALSGAFAGCMLGLADARDAKNKGEALYTILYVLSLSAIFVMAYNLFGFIPDSPKPYTELWGAVPVISLSIGVISSLVFARSSWIESGASKSS